MAQGENGLLTTQGMGSYNVVVLRLNHGIGIIANTAEAASRKAFYPIVTTSASFTMRVGFASYEERERFNRWMRHFMKRVVAGRGFRGAMMIEVPSYDFVRQAVPEGPLNYGEGVTDTLYTLDVSFNGASDPVEPMRSDDISHFVMPRKGGQTARYFYPAGEQVSGADGLEGSLFDAVDGWAVGGGLESDPDLPIDGIGLGDEALGGEL